MKWIGRIQPNGSIHFESEFTRSSLLDYAKKNPNAPVEINVRKKISADARGYLYGALAPAYCEWSNNYDPANEDHRDEVSELLLSYAFGEWRTGLDGKPVKVRRSTRDEKLQSYQYREGIDKITDYFMKEGIPVPNPDLYKRWRDEWSINEPQLTYWEFLRKHNIPCDQSDLSSVSAILTT